MGGDVVGSAAAMRTLLAALQELGAVLDELLGNLEKLLNVVGHCESLVGSKMSARRARGRDRKLS